MHSLTIDVEWSDLERILGLPAITGAWCVERNVAWASPRVGGSRAGLSRYPGPRLLWLVAAEWLMLVCEAGACLSGCGGREEKGLTIPPRLLVLGWLDRLRKGREDG